MLDPGDPRTENQKPPSGPPNILTLLSKDFVGSRRYRTRIPECVVLFLNQLFGFKKLPSAT